MNKHYTYGEWLKECNTYEDTYEKYFELQKETDELWVRIDRAIEYLKDNSMCPDDIEVWGQVETDIYKILKGENNE